MVFGVILSLVSFLCNSLWFLSHFAIFLIHYFFVLMIVLCVLSKFVKLKAVPFDSIQKIFSPNLFPVSYLGSIFDVPENTKASFEYVSMSLHLSILLIFVCNQNIPSQSCTNHCPRIFFSLDVTSDGQLVILDKQTLEKANIHKQINKTSFDEIKDVNISDYHPLGKQFGNQKVLTLEVLLKILEPLNVVVVLNASKTNAAFIEKLKQAVTTHEPMFTKKIIFCCRSPIVVYKV
jgi:hypothetical protein